MKRICAALMCFVMQCFSSSHMAKTETIPLELIFGNPVRAMPQISPDGKYLAYIAPVDGVLNLWVKELDGGKEFSVTNDRKRGIQNYYWTYGSSSLLYVQDVNGDENWNVYSADIHTKEVTVLTPFQGVSVQISAYSWRHPDELLIMMNKDNKELFDLYRLNLKTGDAELMQKNPGNIAEWLCDKDLQVVAYQVFNDDATVDVYVKGEEEDRKLLQWDMSESMLSGLIRVSDDGRLLYACDARGADTTRLVSIDLATGDVEVLFADPRYDVSGAIMDPKTGEVIAATLQKERFTIVPLNQRYAADFAKIQTELPGTCNLVQSQSLDNDQWVIVSNSDDQTPRCYLYNRLEKKLEWMFDFRPELNRYTLSKMEPIAFKARDGLPMEGYLTLPPRKSKSLPMVLFVHGGPQVRDIWGFSPTVQWLANRGYAVLQLNYRGSRGYGKKHLDGGIREWGAKMQDDLTDGVNWAVSKGVADPKRVAIFGGSYGGYAALAGAAFTPNLYAAAVDIVGPSNLVTLLKSIPPYWKMYKAQFDARVGNPDTETAFLEERSPLFSADKIQIPILIGQGANDPRVKQAESEQIVEALKAKKIPYEYVVYQDEGHGFVRPENRLDFYRRAEKFLSKYVYRS